MSKLSGFIIRVQRRFLRAKFGFEKWHISSLDQRQYALDVISHANSRSVRRRCVEIGCGLGDIIRNVRYEQRFGFDLDEKVLNAPRFLSRLNKQENLTYGVFRFPEDELQGHFDLIIMVNWIHHIETSTLSKKLNDYFNNNLSTGGEIIIDTVQDPAYEFNHDVNILINELNCSLIKIGSYPRQRDIWAIKKSS